MRVHGAFVDATETARAGHVIALPADLVATVPQSLREALATWRVEVRKPSVSRAIKVREIEGDGDPKFQDGDEPVLML